MISEIITSIILSQSLIFLKLQHLYKVIDNQNIDDEN